MGIGSNNILDGLDYNKTEESTRDRRFIMFPFGPIEDQTFRESNQNPLALFMYLVSKIVRKPMKDGLNIFDRYFKNNYLACSMSHGKLAKAFNVKPLTIIRWIKKLEKDELIRIEKINIDKYRKKNVYILGTHVNYDFCFFIEEIYTKKILS